jgi:hypothetical protein
MTEASAPHGFQLGGRPGDLFGANPTDVKVYIPISPAVRSSCEPRPPHFGRTKLENSMIARPVLTDFPYGLSYHVKAPITHAGALHFGRTKPIGKPK